MLDAFFIWWTHFSKRLIRRTAFGPSIDTTDMIDSKSVEPDLLSYFISETVDNSKIASMNT